MIVFSRVGLLTEVVDGRCYRNGGRGIGCGSSAIG